MFSLRQVIKVPFKDVLAAKNISRAMSSTGPLVDVKVNDKTGIATVTMQRPPVNGLNLELLTDLSNTFDELAENRSRGMILTSNLPTIFSGGLDIMEMYKPDEKRMREFWSTLQDVWLKLFGSSYPTAAAINGHSPAGGCLLAMSCEYRVMVDNHFTIGLNETALGIVAPSWFQETMRHTIAPRTAEMALTLGTLFSSNDALKIGLIDELATDKADAITKCENFLGRFAKINPLARNMSKMVFRKRPIVELEESREQDVDLFVSAVNNPKVQDSLGKYIAALKAKAK